MQTPLLPFGSGQTRSWRGWASGLLALALPLLVAPAARAQSITNYTFAASTGTFTALSGATTAPTTGGTSDEDVTAVLPIGFQFVYNGAVYTTFSASTNGFLGLGSQVGSALTNNLSTGATRPLLAPLWDDLDLGAATNISYQTSGTAGSRVLSVQWLNAKWRYNATAAAMSFQAKLYEADGHVEFVYRQEAGAVSSPTASIGITAVGTGSGNFLSLSDATAAPTTSSTTETTAIATKPATGQVYSFTPAGGAVIAPSTLTFSAINTTGGTVTFTDNSTNEYGFAVTVTPTAGGTSSTTIVPSTTTAGTGTTYNAAIANLLPNTGYTVQVVALGQGRGSTAGSGTFTTLAGSTLSGTYYVGTGTSPQPTRTYATLTAAASDYSTATLTGPVTFILLDNNYSTAETFPIRFGSVSTASATNTLTIKPNTGATPLITGSVATGAVIMLNGADYVTIDGSNNGTTSQNLTLENSSATGSGNTVLWVAAAAAGDGATNNVVKNTVIRGNSGTGFPQFGVFLGGGGTGVTSPTTSTPAANSNNTFTNNSISKAFYGVFVFGTSATALDQNNSFIDNKIGQAGTANGFGQEGFRGVYQQGLTLRNNEIQNLTSGTATSNLYGIFLADSKGAIVSRNSVHNISYTGTSTTKVWAINSSTTTFNTTANASANRFDNNLVYNINSTAASATWNTVGINCGGGYGDQYYYNTVYLSGQLSAAGGTAGSAAFANGNPSVTTASTNIDVRNNIFSIVNGTGGTATTPLYAHYEQGANVTGSTLNYNDLFVSVGATGAARIGRLNSVDANTLAAWQTATGQEANSVSADPQFVQTTTVPFDLTPNNASLNNAGTPITGVTVDFTGATRGTTPDIGAYEFVPSILIDLAAASLVGPVVSGTSGACFGSAEAVTVSIRNAGANALNFATTPATITVVVTGPTGVATQTLTYTLNTGTLASGASLSVPLTGTGTTVNLSTVGTYSFAITATIAGDTNPANNTLTPSPTVTVGTLVAGTLAASVPSLCVSGTAGLTLTGAQNGNIQLQSSTSATGTFTNITGATSGTYTTPVLTSTTYYRAQITCGSTTVTSNVVSVNVNNPLVASTNTPLAICAGSTATLTATASTGASVRFFSAATGGTALTSTTPGSYTTPALTGNTTYYVEAYTGNTETAGRSLPSVTTGFLGIDTGLVFDATGGFTIQSATIYPVGTGTLTFALYNSAGVELASTAALSVTGTGLTTPVSVPLNLTVPAAGTGYRLLVKAFTGLTDLLRENPVPAGASFPFTSPSGQFSITGGYNASPLAAYYYFYNIILGNECAGATRTAIQVNVTALPATPTVTVSYPNRGTALLTSSAAPAGTTYQWYLGSQPVTGATSQTYTVNGATSPGAYTVRFITTAGSCQSAASTTVNVTATAQPLAGSSLYLFPNPTADGKLTLQLNGYTKAVTLTVIDALGRVVLTKQVAAGQSEAKLDLSGAASGVYTLRAVTQGGTDVRRIVRE